MNKQNLLLAYVTFSCFIRIVICPCPIRKMLGFTANQVSEDWKKAESVYDFSVKNIKGQDVSMEMYKGFVLIIVNVASKCNYASQHYKELVELDSKYREKGLRILAFPCNQFGKQEPGDADSICSFADKQKVKFEVFEKVDVNGNDAHPLFKYLKFKQDGLLVNGIKWNYTKFIVDRKGQPVERHAVNVSPLGMEKSLKIYLDAPAQ